MMHLIKYPLDETVNRFFEEAAAKGFEMRDGQMEMANDICKAITKKRPLAVEAEVGIGKSFAYLVPALIQYFRERRQVIIATSTIALQEQLFKDAQTVLKMLGVHANIILAKGMKNYACMKRVHNLYKRHKDDVYYGRLWRTVRNGQQDKAGITMNISDTDWDKICISGFGKDKCNGGMARLLPKDQREDDFSDYIGIWQYDRCTIQIGEQGEGYLVTIHWADSASEDNVWSYQCSGMSDKMGLECTGGGTLTHIVTAEDGTETRTVVYSDGTAFFRQKDGRLFWSDGKENKGMEMDFEKIG